MEEFKKEINELKKIIQGISASNDQYQQEFGKIFISSFEKLFQKMEAMQIESSKELALYTNRRIDNLYKQFDALLAIHSVINFRYPLPQMRGWPVSPDFANLVLQTVFSEKPKTIVELGSGISSILIGYVLENLGSGQLITLDHEKQFQEKTINDLQNHLLTSYVRVEYAPLVEYEIQGKKWFWYDIQGIPDLQNIDLLIVDGPPAQTQEYARYPAFPLLKDKLSPCYSILTDDGNREEEKSVIKKWVTLDKDLEVQYFETEKGTYLLKHK